MNSTLFNRESLKSEDLKPEAPRFEMSLVELLKDAINWHYQEYFPAIPAVQNAIWYDYIIQDPTCYPLLKVYRVKDTFDRYNNREVEAVISYSIAYPELEKLPGILHFVAGTIAKILKFEVVREESCTSKIVDETWIAEYRTMGDSAGNPILAYIRIPFKFTESI